MTSYEKIFKSFLRKVSDAELANRLEFNTELAIDDMTGYLHSAVAKYNVDDRVITFDDDNQVINEDLSDWEVEMYALGMRIEWLEPLVQARMNISQMFGGKEEKFFSQATHLTAIRDMLNADKLEIRKLRRDYGYHHNSYIEEGNQT